MENPEILLKRRRNADQTRLAKQQLASQGKRREKKNRFIRAESIVAKTLASQREKERVKRINKSIKSHDRDNNKILDETQGGTKTTYDGKPQLLFVVRVKGPHAVSIPQKVFKILQVLRLEQVNTGVFFRLNPTTFQLLKIIAPYIVIGKPSLSTVRSLIQRRSRINWKGLQINLNDNNIVEEALGEHGIICMEDIVHEISTMGETFKQCCYFLLPFQLARQVSGFSALKRLKKLEQRQKERQVSNASSAPLVEIDIDQLLNEMN